MENQKRQEDMGLSEIGIVAYLLVKGFKYTHTETEGGFLYWVFSVTPEFEKALEEYSSHNAMVDPLALVDKYRFLRMLSIRSRKRGYKEEN